VVLLLAAVTVPVLAAFWIALRPVSGGAFPCRGGLAALAVAVALAALVLLQDPWVASIVAGRSTAYSALLHRCGLVTFDEAVQQGLATGREKSVRAAPPAPPCHDARCVMDVAGRTAREALMLPVRAVRSAAEDLRRLARMPSVPAARDALKSALPFQPPVLADHAGLPFFAMVTAGTLTMGWHALRRRRALRPPPGPADRMLVASLVGIGGAGVLLSFAAGLAAALNDQQHDSNILAAYLGLAGAHVAAGFLWLPFVAAWTVLWEPLLASSALIGGYGAFRRLWRAVLAGAGLVLWIALPLLARLNLDVPTRQRGFWGPIGLRDLLALRRVEAAIPPGDGVVVPAEHWNIAEWEHWVIPVGDTTALLPYGERRYLFDVYLGASYPLSWRDLEGRLCSRDPAVRVRFLDRTRARWLLVRDPGARDAADALRRQRMCGESLSALGADLPAERVDDGIYLFRLRRG
jgi:hypothetical protein